MERIENDLREKFKNKLDIEVLDDIINVVSSSISNFFSKESKALTKAIDEAVIRIDDLREYGIIDTKEVEMAEKLKKLLRLAKASGVIKDDNGERVKRKELEWLSDLL